MEEMCKILCKKGEVSLESFKIFDIFNCLGLKFRYYPKVYHVWLLILDFCFRDQEGL